MYRINSVNSICYKTPGGYQNCLPGVLLLRYVLFIQGSETAIDATLLL